MIRKSKPPRRRSALQKQATKLRNVFNAQLRNARLHFEQEKRLAIEDMGEALRSLQREVTELRAKKNTMEGYFIRPIMNQKPLKFHVYTHYGVLCLSQVDENGVEIDLFPRTLEEFQTF